MTSEERKAAIDFIHAYLHPLSNSDYEQKKLKYRDMAIKALEQEPKTGHWVEEHVNEWSRKVFCSECGCPPPVEHVGNGDVYSAIGYEVRINKTKYCPNCGAMMVEPKESEDTK